MYAIQKKKTERRLISHNGKIKQTGIHFEQNSIKELFIHVLKKAKKK